MRKIYDYVIVLSVIFLLLACGTEDSKKDKEPNEVDTIKNDEDISKPIIDSNFKIDISKIDGFTDKNLIEEQYLAVMNYVRSLSIKCNDKAGFSGPSKPLIWDILLSNAAKEHSEDMQISGVYSHLGSATSSDITGEALGRASTFSERINATGYVGGSGENIATVGKGFKTSTGRPTTFIETVDSNRWIGIMEEWIVSEEGHCSNIMNPIHKSVGMFKKGVFKKIEGENTFFFTYWTQEFGVK